MAASCAKVAADVKSAATVWEETQEQPFSEKQLDERNDGRWIPSRRSAWPKGTRYPGFDGEDSFFLSADSS